MYQYQATTLSSLKGTELGGVDLTAVYGGLQPSLAIDNMHTLHPHVGTHPTAGGVHHAAGGKQQSTAGHAQHTAGALYGGGSPAMNSTPPQHPPGSVPNAVSGAQHTTGHAKCANGGSRYADGGGQNTQGILYAGALPFFRNMHNQYSCGDVQFTGSTCSLIGPGGGYPQNAATASQNAATASQPPPVPPSLANGQVGNPGFGSRFASQFEPLPASRFQQGSRSASPTGSGSSQPRDPRLHPTYPAEGSEAVLEFPAAPAAFLTQPIPPTNLTSQNQVPESFEYDSFGIEMDFDMIMGVDQDLEEGMVLDQDPNFQDLGMGQECSDGAGGLLMPDLTDFDIFAYHQSNLNTDSGR